VGFFSKLQSVDNELNESETINILTQHCKYTDVEIKLFEKMSFTSARVMFPFLCKLSLKSDEDNLYHNDRQLPPK
jgi:hypothetical protein